MGFPIWLSTHVSNIIRYSNPDYLTPFQNPTIIANLCIFGVTCLEAWAHQALHCKNRPLPSNVINFYPHCTTQSDKHKMQRVSQTTQFREREILWNSTRQSIACKIWDFWHPYLRTYFLLLRRQILIRNHDHHNIVKITATWSIALIVLYWWFHHVHMKSGFRTVSKLPQSGVIDVIVKIDQEEIWTH